MRRPQIHLVCTPPCIAVWRSVSLFAVQTPTFTAIQFEDCVQTAQQETGRDFTDLIASPEAFPIIEHDFFAFLDAGLAMNEDLIVTGPLWTRKQRSRISDMIPELYTIRVWTVPPKDTNDVIGFNKKYRPETRQWPAAHLQSIMETFSPPTCEEGFTDVHILSEDLSISSCLPA